MHTKPISIFIVEDEPIIALHIETAIAKFGYINLGVVPDGRQAIEQIRKLKPDLVLMDIQLEGPINGIETAKIIRAETDTPVVFLTSQVDKATIAEALTAKPYGYIVKPFNNDELFANIELALFKYRLERPAFYTPQPVSETLFVKEEKKLIKLRLEDIMYLESSDNYVIIHTTKEKVTTRSTFSEIELGLPSDQFFRAHRSFIIQHTFIKTIQQDVVVLEDGTIIPVGKNYKDDFMRKIKVL